jgi:hypothetical protein
MIRWLIKNIDNIESSHRHNHFQNKNKNLTLSMKSEASKTITRWLSRVIGNNPPQNKNFSILPMKLEVWRIVRSWCQAIDGGSLQNKRFLILQNKLVGQIVKGLYKTAGSCHLQNKNFSILRMKLEVWRIVR